MDPETVYLVSRIIDRLRGPTVLVASHIALDIEWDRIYLVRAGRVARVEPPGHPVIRARLDCGRGAESKILRLDEFLEALNRGCRLVSARCVDPVLELISGGGGRSRES